MFDTVRDDLRATLDEIRAAGLHKPERVIGTPQSATVEVTAGGRPARSSTSAPTTTWAWPTTPR